MACRKVFLINLFALLITATVIQSSKLNVARVLLPIFDDFATNFTLQSTDGSCFKWSSTRDDIVQLMLVDENADLGCSQKAIVSTITKDKRRSITDILAEDMETRLVLRCVVIVDEIVSLSITTTTRELVLEEAPEAFEVRAYDGQGNEFSTLTGVPINWIVSTLGPNKDESVLRFITFKESPYETPDTLLDIENRNLRGHKVLLEGVKTGVAKITAQMAQREYVKVGSNEIQLTVIANLNIVPSEVFIMISDLVKFKIIHTSYGVSEEIDLLSSQYYLALENEDIAYIAGDGTTVHGLQGGQTKIILHDKNIESKEPGVKYPSAIINVVLPAYMVLSLLPHKNWATLVDEMHDIVAEVYSKDDRKLTLGGDVVVHTNIGDAFQVKERSKNGAEIHGFTQKEGTAAVTAVLEAVGKIKLDPPLSVSSEIIIYPRIILNPTEVILPWDPIAKPKYDFNIVASGGDGKFLWSSTNNSIGVVTQTGKVHTNLQGTFEVSASMHRNHNNRQSAKIHILPPSRLEIVEYVMEASVGSIIFLHIALFAEKLGAKGELTTHLPFTKCQELPFKVKLSDPKVTYNKDANTTPVGLSCGNVAIIGEQVGTSKVTVTYQGSDSSLLQDSITVSYFKPLKLLQPQDTIVLAVGSSTNLIFVGGPKSSGKMHNKQVTVSSEHVSGKDATNTHNLPGDEEYTVVNVVCLKLGKSVVTLTASNSPKLPNCKNEEASVSVEVICGKPRMIELLPEIKVADAKSCPMDLSAERVVVKSNTDIDLIVKVKDDQGREFLNISSLKLDWLVSPKEIGTHKSLNSVLEKESRFGSAVYATKSYQKINPKLDAGEITVAVQVVGYRKEILNANHVTAEWPEFIAPGDGNEIPPIAATIVLYMVDHTVVSPDVISLYNHPSNHRLLDVKQGSGYYQIALSKENVAEVKYLQKSHQIDIKPLSDGELTIQLIDLCLVSKPAVIVVTVVSIHKLRVEMSDKVEIGKCVSCIVRMYDHNDNLLTIPNMDLIDLNHKFENNIAKVDIRKLTDGETESNNELKYTITGTELGDTKLVVSLGDPNFPGYVSSSPLDLQVFPPLRLFPRNITMILGSQIQYSSKGGPQPSPNLEFSVTRADFAKVEGNGLLKAVAVGKTIVKARAVGTNLATGQRVFYTEDSVDVQIINIQTVKLAAPLTRFQVGATVPMWASGVPEQISPLLLATLEPAISFVWSVQDTNIVKLISPLDPTGVQYESKDTLAIHIQGLEPGRTTIYLKALVPKDNKKNTLYTSSIDVEVFEKLTLISPPNINAQPLLLAPYSTLELKTNMDNLEHVTYRLLDESTAVMDTKALSHQNQAVTISCTGLIKSYGKLGYANVLIISTDSNGVKQTLTVSIEVKPIHYMLLQVKSPWNIKPSLPTTVVPLGVEFDMIASYYDNFGNKFAGGSVELQVRTSRFDLVRLRRGIDNSTFHVQTRRAGITGIKVWSDSVDKTANYFKLHVEQCIKPNVEEITIGDVLCFETPVQSEIEDSRWSSFDDSFLSVDEKYGIAVAIGDKGGPGKIHHVLHSAAALKINVLPIQTIMMDEIDNVLTTATGGIYKAYALISGNDKRSNNLLMGWDCSGILARYEIPAPFTCTVEFKNKKNAEELYDISTKFDHKLGKYYCSLATKPGSNKKYSILPTTEVTISAHSTGVDSNSVNINFIPAFYAPEEVALDETFSCSLMIIGLESVLTNLRATPSDEKVLKLTDKHLEGNKLLYTVKLMDYHEKFQDNKDFMSIIIKSPDTNQEVVVMVRVQGTEKFTRECDTYFCESSIFSFLHGHRILLSITTASVLILIGTFYLYSAYIQPTVNVNVLSAPRIPGTSCLSPNKTYYGETSNRSRILMNSTSDISGYRDTSPEMRRNRRYM